MMIIKNMQRTMQPPSLHAPAHPAAALPMPPPRGNVALPRSAVVDSTALQAPCAGMAGTAEASAQRCKGPFLMIVPDHDSYGPGQVVVKEEKEKDPLQAHTNRTLPLLMSLQAGAATPAKGHAKGAHGQQSAPVLRPVATAAEQQGAPPQKRSRRRQQLQCQAEASDKENATARAAAAPLPQERQGGGRGGFVGRLLGATGWQPSSPGITLGRRGSVAGMR